MPEVTPAALALQIETFVAEVALRDELFYEWSMGTAFGGPNHDGRYPLRDYAGYERLVASPEKLAQIVSSTQVSGLLSFATWAELDAHPLQGIEAGIGGKVYHDTGEHLDQVSGASVLNEGVYRFVAPDKWQRIANLEAGDAAAAVQPLLAAAMELIEAEIGEAEARADTSADQSAGSAAQAAASRTDAFGYAATASAAQQAVMDSIAGVPAAASLPLQAVSLTALRAFTGMTLGRQALLSEPGRAGLFVFDSSNLSAAVAADTRQGIYIAPTSAPSGASGAWRRVIGGIYAAGGTYQASWWGMAVDGATDDTAAINAAITLAAAAGGGVVMLPVGTIATGAAVSGASNVEIVGRGRKASILKALARPDSSAILRCVAVANAAIRDVGFTSAFGDEANRAEMAIFIDACSDVQVERVWIDKKFTWGVLMKGAVNCGIKDSLIDGSMEAHSIEINAGAGTGGSQRCYVVDCVIKNGDDNNIELYSTTGIVRDVRIEGNTLLTPGGNNVGQYGAQGTRIVNNEMRGGVPASIVALESEVDTSIYGIGGNIEGNQFYDSLGPAVSLALKTKGWTVANNKIVNCGRGIYDQGVDNSCINNIVEGSAGTGAYLQGAIRPKLIGNTFKNGSGLAVEGYDAIQVEGGNGAIVKANHCCDDRGSSNRQRYGIFLLGTVGASVDGNVCTGNRSFPIYNSTVGGGGSLVVNNLPDDGITAT